MKGNPEKVDMNKDIVYLREQKNWTFSQIAKKYSISYAYAWRKYNLYKLKYSKL